MNKLIKNPHLIFFISIPKIIIIGILSRDNVFDINVRDSYFVMNYLDFSIMISILFAIIGFGYWIMQKVDRKLSKRLNWVHIGLTFGGTLIVWVLTKFYRTEIMDYKFNNNLSLVITLMILILIAEQLTFMVNIICGLTKKKNN